MLKRKLEGEVRARIAFSIWATVFVVSFFLLQHFVSSVGELEQVLIDIGAVEWVLFVYVILSHYASRSEFGSEKDRDPTVYLITPLIVFFIGFILVFLPLLKDGDFTPTIPIYAIFVIESILLYGVERKLKEKGGLSSVLWVNLSRDKKTAIVALGVMILMISSGMAVVFHGYSVLNQIPTSYYPYPESADPQTTSYLVPLANMSIEANISHQTSKEESVVGEYIWTKVTLTSTMVNESVSEPHLKSIAFPDNNGWSFYYYRSGSYAPGNQLEASGRRLFPEPGSLNFTQQWVVVDGNENNHTVPVYLNLTVYGREAIESFERERERWFETYLQLYLAQKQEGYNLIVVGFSLVFVAALIPEMARLIGKLASRAETSEETSEKSHRPS